MSSPFRPSRLPAAVVVALAALSSSSTPLQDADREPTRRPNVVLIYADDHAQRALGAYGSGLVETPHLDRLASEGVRFTSSFVGNSICGPARATVLTGLHSHAHGKTTNPAGFDDTLPTFATGLQAAGYRTAVVGKWHLPGDPRGFDHWALLGGGYYAPELRTEGGVVRHEGYTTDVVTDEALRWIDAVRAEDPEAPFVAWISHTAAHRTWMPGPAHLDAFRGEELPEPATLFDDHAGRSPGAASAQMRIATDLFPAYDLKLPVTGDGVLDDAAEARLARLTPAERAAWDAAYGPENEAFAAAGLEGDALVRWKYQRYVQDYLRCVLALDESVGRVLAYLDETGLADDTIVVYTSDQGFFLGEHGWYDKRWIYEPSLRTPLLVRWPGVTRPGSTVDALVQNVDLAPTLLEWGGVEPPAAMHGRSLVPLLRGEAPSDWRDAVYYHYLQQDAGRTSHMVARHYGLRTDRWKLVYVYDHAFWELYDLETDPEEQHNLADDPAHAEVLADLRRRLEALRRGYADDLAPPAPEGR